VSQRSDDANMNAEAEEMESSSKVREEIQAIMADCPRAKQIKILNSLIAKLNDEEAKEVAQERTKNESQRSM
jgi:hypothetical protein